MHTYMYTQFVTKKCRGKDKLTIILVVSEMCMSFLLV